MSYSVVFVDDEGVEERYWNPTYNYGPIFKRAFGGDGILGLDGMNCRHAITFIRNAVNHMLAEYQTYRQLESPTGWGTYDGALRFFVELFIVCQENPTWKLRVSQ